jgi:hypothetical protein
MLIFSHRDTQFSPICWFIVHNVALEQDDIVDIKELGLKEAVGVAPVSPLDTLVSTWGAVKYE